MKNTILLISVLLLSGFVSFSQEVQFSAAIITSGGSSHQKEAVTISRWRIGQINVLTVPSGEVLLKQAEKSLTDDSEEWSVCVYPNPVNMMLNVHFDIESRGKYTLEIYDMKGSKILSKNNLIILPGQEEELELADLKPALYLLKVIPYEKGNFKIYKITKQ